MPFGSKAAKLLQKYLYYFRPDPLIDDRVFLCLDGTPMSENTIKLIFTRLAKKAGVSRLHIHLLRHTFATRYLMNGGDAFSLQRILGHSTLEMTRRYVDMVALETVIKKRLPSPMDRVLLDMKRRSKKGKNAHSGAWTGSLRRVSTSLFADGRLAAAACAVNRVGCAAKANWVGTAPPMAGLLRLVCAIPPTEPDVRLSPHPALRQMGYPESTEGRPWGQPLKKLEGAPVNLG